MKICLRIRTKCALAAGCLVASGGAVVQAQSAGQFVIPGIRASGGTDFAYWDFFTKPPGQTYNYNYANPPALLDGKGEDDNGNPTTALAPRATLWQTGSGTCFVTSSGALYDYMGTTAFETRYAQPGDATGPVTNVIFQTQTGGVRFDLNNIRLVFARDGETISLAPEYKALDDPQSGAFAERLVSAFQWDLTGQDVHDFRLVYSAPGSSMPLWQAQLDVVSGSDFQQQLGYLLLTRSAPVTRYNRAGSVSKNLAVGEEERFFLPGKTLTLSGDPSPGWAHVGWLRNGVVTAGPELPVTFGNSDLTVTAVFAPEDYDSWRDLTFNHSNVLLGQPPENTDDAFSGPDADPDGDGLDNFSEFAFGGDPYVADKKRVDPSAQVVSVEGQDYAAITYHEGAGGPFPSILYTVRVSQDAATWEDNDTAAMPVTTEVSRVLQSDGATAVTVRSTTPLSNAPRLFFSVKAQ